MTDEEKIKFTRDMFGKKKNEINEMFNSGMFNEIVLGAIKITLENLNHFNDNDIEEVIHECKEGTFNQYTAEKCRAAYNTFGRSQ